MDKQSIAIMVGRGRSLGKAELGDTELGPFSELPGTWKSLPGRGWNMIALPFDPGPLNYRLLMNQYDEELVFQFVDKAVPNRGLDLEGDEPDGDQFVVALDYQQTITQIDADDRPISGLAGGAQLPIHHEPGLFLHMTNLTFDGIDIARLATVPHGNSALGLGRAQVVNGAPEIPNISGLPIGVDLDLSSRYLAPYKHFADNPFKGLFNPVSPNDLLRTALAGSAVRRTTVLSFDTTLDKAGISNIPFVERQADASEMQATFWIQELEELDINGDPVMQIQYSQTVMLDFFERRDGVPGLIKWPHVSINTLRRVPTTSGQL